MKLKVDEIAAEAKELSFREPEAEVNRILSRGAQSEWRFKAPIEVELSYYRAGTELFFEGRLAAMTGALCARCAEEFESRTEHPFRVIMTPRSIAADADPSSDPTVGDYAVYDGDGVDLSPLICEELLLALPTRPLCHEECRGLCPRCGTNLNQGECRCPEPASDPRLAVLRTLKIQRS
ncbi:MAG TPA: DUF177 domain-containing protein [Candidatus Binataceae bacterium]|nr:DUF177 domain-containing protein [Candidatus Binataceae bacterium]